MCLLKKNLIRYLIFLKIGGSGSASIMDYGLWNKELHSILDNGAKPSLLFFN